MFTIKDISIWRLMTYDWNQFITALARSIVSILLYRKLPFDDDEDVGMRSGFLSLMDERDAWLCLCPPWSVIQSSIPRWRGICVVPVMSDSDEGDWPMVEFALLLINLAVMDPFLSSWPKLGIKTNWTNQDIINVIRSVFLPMIRLNISNYLDFSSVWQLLSLMLMVFVGYKEMQRLPGKLEWVLHQRLVILPI